MKAVSKREGKEKKAMWREKYYLSHILPGFSILLLKENKRGLTSRSKRKVWKWKRKMEKEAGGGGCCLTYVIISLCLLKGKPKGKMCLLGSVFILYVSLSINMMLLKKRHKILKRKGVAQ